MADLSIPDFINPNIGDLTRSKAAPGKGTGGDFNLLLAGVAGVMEEAGPSSSDPALGRLVGNLAEPPALPLSAFTFAGSSLEPTESAPAAAPESSRQPTRLHTVRRGDTLSEIVADELKRNGTAHSRKELYQQVREVARANGLNNRHRIYPGQKIDLSSLAAGSPDREASGIRSNLDLQAPANGRISSRFGLRTHPILGDDLLHTGIDIVVPNGTPVKPLEGGQITFAGEKNGYGLVVDVDHGQGLVSRYAHLSEILVSQGSRIEADQVLGRSGQSGMVTGPHLHLEIRQDDKPIDPLSLIARDKIESGSLLAEIARGRTAANRL